MQTIEKIHRFKISEVNFNKQDVSKISKYCYNGGDLYRSQK